MTNIICKLETHSNIEPFIERLKQLPDTRDNRGKRHSLVFILVSVIFAILVGRSMMSGIHRYIENKIVWLREITGIEDARLISRAHLPRLLDKSIDWNVLNQLIQEYFGFHILVNGALNEWTAIDGKVLRGSLKGGEKQAVIHAISHDTRSEVAQACQSGKKSSEIPVVRQLLKETGLENQKITLDAHHCNPETTAQIASADGIYLTQVKDNQPTLLKQCQQLEKEGGVLFGSESTEKAHGRLVTRSACIFSMATVSLDKRWKTSKLQTLIVIKRETILLKTGKESHDSSYYISNSNIDENSPEMADDLVQAVRKHWGVESNNWILDVTFNEDKVRIKAKNQAYVMSTLRAFSLQLLRKADMKNFQAALEKFADLPLCMENFLRQVKFL
jgi:predicted transposase YbfD/YdcC